MGHKGKLKPCKWCSSCEEQRFEDWRKRVEAGLSPNTDDGGSRIELIHDIHESVGLRFPLGIAERLNEIITMLHVNDDADARKALLELETDEQECLIHDLAELEKTAKKCSVAKARVAKATKA